MLDPPLHEFLPKREDPMVDLARLPAADTKAKKALVAKYERFGANDLTQTTIRWRLKSALMQFRQYRPMRVVCAFPAFA